MKIACFYQPGHNKNRTDGMNIWLVFYQRSVEEKIAIIFGTTIWRFQNAVNISFFPQSSVLMNMNSIALKKGYSPVDKCVEIRIKMSRTESGINAPDEYFRGGRKCV